MVMPQYKLPQKIICLPINYCFKVIANPESPKDKEIPVAIVFTAYARSFIYVRNPLFMYLAIVNCA